MGRTAAIGNNNQQVKVATTIGAATPLLLGEKAIARLYFPVGSKVTSIAPWGCTTENGSYTPCLNPLVEPAVPILHTIDVLTNGGNIGIAPQVYDATFLKFVATFTDATTSEVVSWTAKE